MSKFDKIYMGMAECIALASHDPKWQVGCVIVKDRHVISEGYNGTPRGTDPYTRDVNDKTLPTVIHAEMNALLHAKENLHGATAYCTLSPCLKCAIHLYQAGIKKVIYKEFHGNKMECYEAHEFFEKVGVEYVRNPGVNNIP